MLAYMKRFALFFAFIQLTVVAIAGETDPILSPHYKGVLKVSIERQQFVQIKFPYVETNWVKKQNTATIMRYPIDAKTAATEICSLLLRTNSESMAAYSKIIKTAKPAKTALIKNAKTKEVEFLENSSEIYSYIVCNNALPSDFVGNLLTANYSFFDIDSITPEIVVNEIKRIEHKNKKVVSKKIPVKNAEAESQQAKLKKLNVRKVNGHWVDKNGTHLLLNPEKLKNFPLRDKNKKIIVYIDHSGSTRYIRENLDASRNIIESYYKEFILEFKVMPKGDGMTDAWNDAPRPDVLHVYVLSDGFWDEWYGGDGIYSESSLVYSSRLTYQFQFTKNQLKSYEDKYKQSNLIMKIVINSDLKIIKQRLAILESNMTNEINRLKGLDKIKAIQLKNKNKITHFTFVTSEEDGESNVYFQKVVAPILQLDNEFYYASIRYFNHIQKIKK